MRAKMCIRDSGKMLYYASVTDLNHLQKTLDGLYAAAAPNDQILDDPTVRRVERNRDTVLSFADCSVRDIPAKDKQALLLSYLPLLSEDKCVTMPSGSYLDRSSLFHFQSSLGADITYDYQTCGLSFSCDMAEGEKKFSGQDVYKRQPSSPSSLSTCNNSAIIISIFAML